MISGIKRIASFIGIVVMVWYAGTASADEDKVISWKDCVRAALKNNPSLIAAEADMKGAEAGMQIAGSAGLPQIGANAAATSADAAGSDGSIESYSLGVSGRQLLYDRGKTAEDVKAAEARVKATTYTYRVVSSNVRLDVRTAFVELLHAQQLILLTEDIAARRMQNLQLVRLRYEAGREHKGALLTAEADLARAEFEVAQARRSIPLRQRQLFAAVGMDGTSPVRVTGEFSIGGAYDAKPKIENLADTTPFLRELVAQKEAARYSLQSAQADLYPKIYLSGSLGLSSPDFPPDETGWSAGVSLAVPIFEGGSRRAEISRARSGFARAEAEERGGRYSVLETLENAWKNLRDAITNVSVQKKFQDAAEERAKIAGAQYESGLISFDDWIIIENNLVSARKNHLRARADMLLSEADWIQATGGTLADEEE